FQGGTRVPFLVRWPERIKGGQVSDALFSQVDIYASLAALTGQSISGQNAPDSFNNLETLLGENINREYIVQQSINNTLSLVENNWKYIEPSKGPAINKNTNIELGNNPLPQLYDLKNDPSETANIADQHPEIVSRLRDKLAEIRASERTRQE